MNRIKEWLMSRYCPDYWEKMPQNDTKEYYALAIVVYGYWGDRSKEVARKKVRGLRNAYIEARWLALKAQWKRPLWLCNCGINYAIREEKHVQTP